MNLTSLVFSVLATILLIAFLAFYLFYIYTSWIAPMFEKPDIKIGYMCRTDFDWEIGEANGGTKVYPSIEDLKECRKCAETCGIVKVKVELVKIEQPGKRW